jgi:hypothetical protein
VLAGTQAAAAAAEAAEMSQNSVLAMEALLAGPGGRHDNDHIDYR